MYCALYVDDEADLLEIARIFLEASGEYRVTTAISAQEALNLLAARKFDVIISDYQMPEMDGIAFLKRVREKFGKIPFILFTGRGREEVVIDAINNGADFYLQKGGNPIAQFAELLHKMQHAVRRNLAEISLQASERQLRMAQEIGRTGSWEYNVSTDRLWGSAEGGRIFGYPPVPHDFRLEDIESCIPEKERVHQALTDLLQSGKEYDLEYLIHPADGSAPKMIHSVARLERDEQGRPIRVVGVIQDITTQKLAESVVLEKGERYRILVENAHDGILVNEMTPGGPGNFIEINDEACRIIGMSREDLLDRCLVDLDTQDMKARSPEIMRHILQNGHADFQTSYRSPDGKEKFLDISVSVFDLHGRQTMLSVVRDRTDILKAEEALRQANRKLGLLSSITRHDISNRLLALNGFVLQLQKKVTDPDLAEYFTRIRNISVTISAMIQFTREYEKVGVAHADWQNVERHIHTSAKTLDLGTITVQNDIPDKVEVYADPMIGKVFFNLIDNALHHGGSGLRFIRFSQEMQGEDTLLICEDDGEGVPEDIKSMIFDREFGKNTGYGLFLSKEILGITGITIRETGVPGKGARFEITVPKGGCRIQKPELAES